MKVIIFGKLIMVIASIVVLLIGVDMNMFGEELDEAKVVPDKGGMVSEGFQLSAQLEKEWVGPCEPVILIVTLKNVSEKVLSLADSRPERDYEIVVKDEQGEETPLTTYGKNLMDSAGVFRRVLLKMNAGQELQNRLLINRIYDMSISGTYSIIVKRNVFRQDGKGFAEVISNTIKVEITEQSSTHSGTEDTGKK